MEERIKLTEQLYGKRMDVFLEKFENSMNNFQAKNQLWFDENPDNEETPIDVHKHYILQWSPHSIGFGILKSSNLPDIMHKELQNLFNDLVSEYNK